MDIRQNLNNIIGELEELKNLIFSTQQFAEEVIRINEMTVSLLAFSAYDDDRLSADSVDISRICNGIHNYTEFLKSSM